ncbi:MAG: GAF domain-containing sensor histidine kinase, partial [Anaerolineae bacterium]
LATFLYGQAGGLIVLALSVLIMLPRVFLISAYPSDALLETIAVGVVGYLIVWLLTTQEREKQLRQNAVARLRTINAISTGVTASLELEEILNTALDKVLEATQTQIGGLFLVDRMTRDLTLAVQRGISADLAEANKRCPVSQGLCGWVARTGKPRIVKDLTAEQKGVCSLFEQVGARSLLVVPLISRGRVTGVLELADTRPARFTAEDIDLLSSVGSAIGVAIENACLCNNIRYYAQQMTRAQENERARIARELHDVTIQALVVLSREIETLGRDSKELAPAVAERLQTLHRMTDEIIQDVRRFSRDLRPSTLDDLGLLPTLEGLAVSLTERDGIPTRLYVVGEKRRLTPDTELVLFRVAQEALNNVKKHAEATAVTIIVKFSKDLVEMTIQDNGKGFNLAPSLEDLAVTGHLGLIGMRERARLLGGTLSIQTQPGRGTKVTISVPAVPPPRPAQ